MDAEATVRAYYAALDDARYDDLRAVLAPGFTQRRPDRTFEDREAFVAFVRDDRPHADTAHHLAGVYSRPPTVAEPGTRRTEPVADADADPAASGEFETVLARGVVERNDGTVVVRFVDCFDVLADRIVALDTYTR